VAADELQGFSRSVRRSAIAAPSMQEQPLLGAADFQYSSSGSIGSSRGDSISHMPGHGPQPSRVYDVIMPSGSFSVFS
jgi:hypothetical protein